MWEFWHSCQGETYTPDEICDILENHLRKNYELQVSFILDQMVGFLLYQHVFDDLYHIKAFFVLPEYRHLKAGLTLMNACFPKPCQIIFQSHNFIIPNELKLYIWNQITPVKKDVIRNSWLLEWKGV